MASPGKRHASASTTLNFYAHAVPENDAKAAALVGTLLAGGETGHSEKKESVANVS
jgi:hypothetical protein